MWTLLILQLVYAFVVIPVHGDDVIMLVCSSNSSTVYVQIF